MPFVRGTPKPPNSGRKKGVANKTNAQREAAIAEQGITPLEYMIQVMRDVEAEPGLRMDAAKSAAPYVHPKLSSIEHAGAGGGALKFEVVQVATGIPRPPSAD